MIQRPYPSALLSSGVALRAAADPPEQCFESFAGLRPEPSCELAQQCDVDDAASSFEHSIRIGDVLRPVREQLPGDEVLETDDAKALSVKRDFDGASKTSRVQASDTDDEIDAIVMLVRER